MSDSNNREELNAALAALAAVIARSEKAMGKFAQGTSQHTLQTNRINALRIASSLIKRELEECNVAEPFTRAECEKALAPITSLISKSEKAQAKLKPDTWQHTMLGNHLKALRMALPLLEKALR